MWRLSYRLPLTTGTSHTTPVRSRQTVRRVRGARTRGARAAARRRARSFRRRSYELTWCTGKFYFPLLVIIFGYLKSLVLYMIIPVSPLC